MEEEKFEYKNKEVEQEYNEERTQSSFKEINPEVKAELDEQLQELETVRKRYFAKYKLRNSIFIGAIVLFVGSILLTIVLGPLLQLDFSYMFKWFFFIFGFFFVGIVFQFLKKGIEKQYEHHFKYTVLERIVDLFFSDLRYTPKRMILEADFKKSKIDQTFKHPYKKYKGEDYFEGTYRGYPISFSELATIYTKKTVKKSRGKTEITYTAEPLFVGLFFMLEIPENTSLGSFWGIVPYLKEGELLDDFPLDNGELQGLILGSNYANNIPQFKYKLLPNSIPLNADLLKQVEILSQKMKEPLWVTYENNRLYIGVSTAFKNNNRVYKMLEEEGLMKGAMKMYQLKEDMLNLFSPPNLQISVLDNKEVILTPIQEIQSCLDIIDEILILFNQVSQLEK